MFLDTLHIDDAFRDYICKRLLPHLGYTPQDCTIVVPLSGMKSCIRLVKMPSGKGYAVRAFARGEMKAAHQLYFADGILEKNKIPAPRLVDFAERYSRRGVTFVAEEYLNGKNWGEITSTPGHACSLGALIARLHRVEANHWGTIEPHKKQWGTFGASQLRRVRHRLHRVKKFAPDTVSRTELRAVREWFRAFRPRLDSITSFQLIHDKLNKGNILYSSEKGNLFLLDFATLRYGYRAKDTVKAELDLLGNDATLIEAFRDEYFGFFPPGVREEYEKLSIFYYAYHHLSKSALNLKRDYESRTLRYNFKTGFYDNFLHHWRALWDIISS